MEGIVNRITRNSVELVTKNGLLNVSLTSCYEHVKLGDVLSLQDDIWCLDEVKTRERKKLISHRFHALLKDGHAHE